MYWSDTKFLLNATVHKALCFVQRRASSKEFRPGHGQAGSLMVHRGISTEGNPGPWPPADIDMAWYRVVSALGNFRGYFPHWGRGKCRSLGGNLLDWMAIAPPPQWTWKTRSWVQRIWVYLPKSSNGLPILSLDVGIVWQAYLRNRNLTASCERDQVCSWNVELAF